MLGLVQGRNVSISNDVRKANALHGVERGLKAYLVQTGSDIKHLRELGHHLVKAMEVAIERGMNRHCGLTRIDIGSCNWLMRCTSANTLNTCVGSAQPHRPSTRTAAS